MDTKTSSLKRTNDSTNDNKRQRPKPNLNQAPRIPVRSTLASRYSRNSPTNSLNTTPSTSTSSTRSNKSLTKTTRKPPLPVNFSKQRLTNQKKTGNSANPTRSTNGATTVADSVTLAKHTLVESNTSTEATSPAEVAASEKLTTLNELITLEIPITSTKRPSTGPIKRPSTGAPKRPSIGAPKRPSTVLNTAPTGPSTSKRLATMKRPSSSTIINSVTKKPATSIPSLKTPKFPGDIKGKLNYLQAQLEEAGGQVSHIEKVHNDLESTVQSRMSLLEEAKQKVKDLESTIEATRDRYQQEIQKHKDKYILKNRDLILQNETNHLKSSTFEQQLKDMQAETTRSFALIDQENVENEMLKITLENANASYSEVGAALNDLQMKLKSADSALAEHEGLVQDLSIEYDATEDSIEGLEKALFDQEKLRRKLHNKIQDLKGNIRVFCRVRPSVGSNAEAPLANIRIFGEDLEKMELTEQVSSTLGRSSTKSYTFSFDRVFSADATQKDCFVEISQLVQSALDGFNVCIFAYGQTGSGKTFTMQGPPDITEDTVGMIPRAVQQIYDVAQKLKRVGWEYTMEGQFLEIYNETIHDLLGDASRYGQIKHEIHHEKNGKTTVSEMTLVHLDSPSQVKMMLKKASQNRATGATNLNERSSRSHSVFTLRLTGHNILTGEHTVGILNLIDLAGSERLSLSGSVGDRLRETQAINKSLSCLGDVIHALVNNKEGGHIPYRNSKLTYLLRNSLGGNCKTLMFVNVSPMLEHFGESLCSLRFATKVNSCKIGIVKKSL